MSSLGMNLPTKERKRELANHALGEFEPTSTDLSVVL